MQNIVGEQHSDSSSDDEELEFLALFGVNAPLNARYNVAGVGGEKRRFYDGAKSGQDWIDDLKAGHHDRMLNAMRMNVPSFLKLCEILVNGNFIKQDYRKRVQAEEAIGMALHCVSHDERHRNLAERFLHSTETIHRNIKEALQAIVRLAPILIRPRNETGVHPKIYNSNAFYPWFKDCVGAIDGTLIPASAPLTRQRAFRSRKGEISQNVLAACDHDMRFTYIYAGVEGSAHDARVFQHVVLSPDSSFPMPPAGKYYLVDSAYKNMPGFLAPHKGHRYQRDQFGGGSGGPRGKYELFNHRHSQLRNVIERTFGVLKARFPILKGPMPNYLMNRQVELVIACCVLHNFIRDEHPHDELFARESGEDEEDYADPGAQPQQIDLSAAAQRNWNSFRMAITDHMFDHRNGRYVPH
ncbi:putative nuclease HARBI1 [Coffea eugenioides]|uniref:putative nuclease HARBI1 n=1 Tax=Coffea eugenioides TaxID=49369 RepID=UPI000F60C1E1|nr:putative nuclease HARBI1 [Coffea eugenioides]